MNQHRLRYRQSLIALPALYLVAAILLVLMPELDSGRDVAATPGTGIDTARDILSATATGMIAFTGFVVRRIEAHGGLLARPHRDRRARAPARGEHRLPRAAPARDRSAAAAHPLPGGHPRGDAGGARDVPGAAGGERVAWPLVGERRPAARGAARKPGGWLRRSTGPPWWRLRQEPAP